MGQTLKDCKYTMFFSLKSYFTFFLKNFFFSHMPITNIMQIKQLYCDVTIVHG